MVAATVIDFGGPILIGMQGWLVMPTYFVERHGITIIALGEAIVEVGSGAGEDLSQANVLLVVVLAVLVAAGLGWSRSFRSPWLHPLWRHLPYFGVTRHGT